MVRVREMIRSRRNDDVRWAVSTDAGQVIGWVRQHHIGRASRWFYEATAIDQDGDPVCLENSGDRDERIAIVVALHEHPEPWRGIHWHPR